MTEYRCCGLNIDQRYAIKVLMLERSEIVILKYLLTVSV